MNNKLDRINEEYFNLDTVISAYISLEASIEKKDLIQIIKLASNYLNESQKETFILKWFSGLSIVEIAEITRDTVNTIKHRSQRAMQKTLEILKPIIDELNQKG